jgi:hypothetical protein
MSNSLEYPTINYDMINKYVNFIEDLMVSNSIVDGCKMITDLEEFREFRKINLITIGDARYVDMYFHGKSGKFWVSAYDYPEENQELIDNGCFVKEARDVGILTFNMGNRQV